MTQQVDAVVIGAGHHGLVAAARLADAGWDVLVLEGRDVVGGAVSSLRRPGHVVDHCSAFHPLAAASPAIVDLGLEDHGLIWARTDRTLAHVTREGAETGDALLCRDPAATAEVLDADHPGDGGVWLRLVEQYQRLREPFLAALLTQWPPTTTAAVLARRLGTRGLIDFTRFALLPVSRMGTELFGGRLGADLLTGNAMHADIPPDAPGSGIFGWLLSMLAQDVGFPAPVGGARTLADAMAARARAAGAEIRTRTSVTGIEVRAGRAVAVRTADGRRIRVRHAVVADTTAPALYRQLLPEAAVPRGLRDRLDRFVWDAPTVKVNYLLRGPMPWRSPAARGTSVVHLGPGARTMARWSAELACGAVPPDPFLLVGQMTTTDPTRSMPGTESLWVYGHLPRAGSAAELDAMVPGYLRGVAGCLEEFAPGWRDLVQDEFVQTPAEFESNNPNLVSGSLGGGTMQLFQQLMWRPVAGLGGPRTHLRGLYLGSAAIHPGGGVHGACGALAADAALRDAGPLRAVRRRVATATLRRIIAHEPTF